FTSFLRFPPVRITKIINHMTRLYITVLITYRKLV
ncbi:hypothetical protein ALC56_12817, partial [Trachymyrmex septentrionalis]